MIKVRSFVNLLICAAVAIVVVFGMRYAEPKPLTSFGTDTVTPTQARAGDSIKVIRSFRVKEPVAVIVVRTLVRGNCRSKCEIVDLVSGPLTLRPGDYVDVGRDHEIPKAADPGDWDLVFTISYQGIFGRTLTMDLPVLKIKVVE